MKFSRAASTVVVLAVVVVLMCSALAAASAPRAATPKADDVGITKNEIRLAMIADVDNAAVPGLFQPSVNAMNAWASLVNKQGGIAGRQVKIDFIDSKLNADEARNAVIQACSQDFAMVGTEALFLANFADGTACKDARGAATGLPNIAGIALEDNERCAPTAYVYSSDATNCPTLSQHPQTYVVEQGDLRYYKKQLGNAHGVYIVPSDLKSSTNAVLPTTKAGGDLGIKPDADGNYLLSTRATQNELTPIVKAIKDSNSNVVYNGTSPAVMVLLRREAKLQGVNSVKFWACNQGCYDASLVKTGGADVEGTHAVLTTLPFYSEYQSNPGLKALVAKLGGIDKFQANALNSYISALLFQEAATKAAANGGTLTRASLLSTLKATHAFTAGGLIGPTDVGGRKAPQCIVITQVKSGKFVRVSPTKPGTFDCSKNNYASVQMDLS